ncbi:MAG TPA: ABC transporter ATP-binding protein, partial [Vampirovibrionales bacterium]
MQNHIQVNNLYLIKQVLPFLKPYKKQLIFVLCTIPFIALFQGVQPFLLKNAIDFALKKTSENIWLYPSLLFVAITLLFLIRSFQNYIVQTAGQSIISDIRKKLFTHLQTLSIDFFETNQTGKLLTRLTNDIEALSETFSSGLVGGANDLFTLIGITGFMLYIDWKITIVQLSLIPILVIFTRLVEEFYRKANAKSRQELSQINSLFQESLLGLVVIKIFNQTKQLANKFRGLNDKYIKEIDKTIAADSSFSALIELVGILAIILVIATSLLFFKDISSGKLVAFISYSQMLFTPIRNLSEKFTIFQAGFTSTERIVDLLDQAPSIQTHTTNKHNFQNTSIQFQDVSFQYNKDSEKVLKDITFKLAEGESLGLVGQTGSGKSTLIKLICRFYDPSEGSVHIDGINLKDVTPFDLRKEVLMIPQRSFLFSGTIKDNLILDKDISDKKLNSLVEETGLGEMVKPLRNGLNTELRERGMELSSGQKQLISLTRAIIQDP